MQLVHTEKDKLRESYYRPYPRIKERRGMMQIIWIICGSNTAQTGLMAAQRGGNTMPPRPASRLHFGCPSGIHPQGF